MASNQVLLVGERTSRLEVDLVPFGFSCVAVDTANDAVAHLKGNSFPLVVVAGALPDMTGPAFVDGLLRHFDPSVVVLCADVDAAQAQALQRSPKVQIFPASADGGVIANHLYKRAGAPTSPTTATGTLLGSVASSFPPGTMPSPYATPAMAPPAVQSTPALAYPPPTPAFPSARGPFDLPHTSSSMPAPAASWPPHAARPASAPPFFAGFNSSPQAPSAAPTLDELARVTAELSALRARLVAAETENTALRGELDAARRAASAPVADVMALSDEGQAIDAELDELRSRVALAEAETESAASQLDIVRAERDRLAAELVDARQAQQDRALELDALRRQVLEAHADAEQHRAAAETAERALSDFEARAAAAEQAVAEVAALRVELDAVRALLAEKNLEKSRALEQWAAERDALIVERDAAVSAGAALMADRDVALAENATALAERDAALAQVADLSRLLQAARQDVDLARAEKAEVEAAWAAEQQRIAALELKIGEEQAARLDLESSLRHDLDECLRQLAVAEDSARAERDRADRAVADAASVRALLEQLTHEQARLVGEMEQLRPVANEVERARATVVDLQRQLEAALGTESGEADTTAAIEEAVRARTRELLELARAIEPFTWGLQQAISFFAGANVDGAQRHLQALQLLEKTLERLNSSLDKL